MDEDNHNFLAIIIRVVFHTLLPTLSQDIHHLNKLLRNFALSVNSLDNSWGKFNISNHF